MDLILKLVEIADSVLIGGGMAFTFLKAKGKEVGNSLVDDSMISDAKKILTHARNNSVRINLPVDVIAAESMDKPQSIQTVPVSEIPKNDLKKVNWFFIKCIVDHFTIVIIFKYI